MRRALLTLVLVSCYKPSFQDGQWACPDLECPDGFQCGADGFCHRPADAGVSDVPATIDGSIDVAVPIDGSIDVAVPIDGSIDVAVPIDGSIDVAGVIDAAPVDAPFTLCVGPAAVAPGTPVTATLGTISESELHLPSPCTAATGPEAVWQYTLTVGATADLVWAASSSGGADLVAYIRTDCDGSAPDSHCADAVVGSGGETVEWNDAAPGTYYLFIDSSATGSGLVSGTLTVRQIVGLGDACDGVSTRCGVGLLCSAGTCADAATVCASEITGTLTSGVEVTRSFTASADSKACDVGAP